MSEVSSNTERKAFQGAEMMPTRNYADLDAPTSSPASIGEISRPTALKYKALLTTSFCVILCVVITVVVTVGNKR